MYPNIRIQPFGDNTPRVLDPIKTAMSHDQSMTRNLRHWRKGLASRQGCSSVTSTGDSRWPWLQTQPLWWWWGQQIPASQNSCKCPIWNQHLGSFWSLLLPQISQIPIHIHVSRRGGLPFPPIWASLTRCLALVTSDRDQWPRKTGITWIPMPHDKAASRSGRLQHCWILVIWTVTWEWWRIIGAARRLGSWCSWRHWSFLDKKHIRVTPKRCIHDNVNGSESIWMEIDGYDVLEMLWWLKRTKTFESRHSKTYWHITSVKHHL